MSLFVALSAVIAWEVTSIDAVADEPILRVNSTGATSFVTSLAFSPDGKTLYSAGFDKVVRVWQWDEEAARFRLQPETTYRIPIGPGEAGSINTLAVSADGNWLVVGGSALMRGANDFRKPGGVFPTRGALTPEMRLDQGRLFLFDTRTRERRVLRAHNGSVISAEFLPGSSRYFVSAADEWEPAANDGKGDRIGRVRLFDLEAGREIASAALPPINSRPGIAPLRGSDDPEASQIGLAWGDGKLRIWDVASQRMVIANDGTQSNNAIGYAIEQKRLLTGTFDIQERAAQGELNLWSVRAQDGEPSRIGRPTILANEGNRYPFPRALTLLSRADETLVAVVSRMTTPPSTINGWRVELLDLKNDGLASQRRFSLTRIPAGSRMPALTSSSDGQWFAIGGSGDQTIRLYKTTDVLNGNEAPYQQLTGQGRVIRTAGFVRRDEQRGLELLGTQANERWVFDIDGRKLTPGRITGWTADRPAATGFEVRPETTRETDSLRTTLTVTGPGLPNQANRRGTRIDLPADHEFITSAILPNARGRFLPVEIPIIAIASHRFGLPRLALYNLATGETIRELSGHNERLLALAFSGDGRFLVSTANDQTVCVWSLVDLDLSVGIRGGINGLALDNRDEGVEVVQIDPTAKVRNQLEVGDRIEALVIDGQTIEIDNARRFYATMWKTAPGTAIVVKKANGDATITVEQGIDERKPLFFLYLEASDAGEADEVDFDWVAWSPLGPFDSSGEAIERHLGWHFNGKNEEEPVRFALLEEYPELRRPGILGEMLDVGRLPEVAVQPLERPTMRLRIPGFSPAGPKLPLIVDRSPERFELTVLGLTPRQVQTVRLLVDNQDAGELTFVENQRWQVTNAQAEWDRGVHRLTARVVTNEVDPQTFEQSLEFSYFLPAPQIDLPNGRQDWTDDEAYDVSAVITPKADETVVVSLHRAGSDEQPLKTWEVVEREVLSFPVTLTPGLNQFEVTAYNQYAANPDSREESRTVRMVVAYAPRRPKPPARLDLFVEPRADEPASTPLSLHPGETLPLEESQPKITIEASSEEELPELEMQVEPADGVESLPTVPLSFKDEDGKRRASVPLELPAAGDYEIRIYDRTNELTLFQATIRQLAKLPEVQLQSPQDGDILLAGRDDPQVDLNAVYVGDFEADTVTFQALVNGQPVDVVVEAESKTITGELPLRPGDNSVILRWSNAQRTRETRPVTIAYRQPPEIRSTAGEVGESPLATLTMQVASKSELDRVSVNGAIWASDKVDFAPNGEEWTATISDVPVAEGINRFELSVWNQEARSITPATVRVEYVAPRELEKADVLVLSPQNEAVTDQSRFEIEFEVSSSNQLLDVDLYNGNILVDRGQDLISIRPNAQGDYVYRRKLEVQLHSGPNHFHIVTINQAGRQETLVKTITYQEPPVRLTIEGVTLPGDPTNLIRPELLGNGRIKFDQPIESDVVIVHAIADWRGLSDEFRKERAPTIQVLVNEFLQISNGQVDGEVSRFELPILLSKPENSVRVVLPHYKGEASSQAEFSLACTNPTPNKRLHLLIVGIGATEDQSRGIEDRVLETLRAERQSERTFRTDTFQNGRIYGPIVGSDLNQGDLLSGLINIQDTIRISKGQDNYLDVVMLYVEGGRMVSRGAEFVVTTQPANFPISRRIARDPYAFQNYSLPSSSLRAMVQSTDGAKILMLDMLEGSSEEDVADVSFDPEARAAMMRFMWVEGEEEQRPFPAFLETIAKKRDLQRLDQWRSEFLKLAESIKALKYNETVSPSIADLILVDSRRE